MNSVCKKLRHCPLKYALPIIIILYLYIPDFIHGKEKYIIIDNFQMYNNNLFEKWLLRSAEPEDAGRIYEIHIENKNKFLRAKSVGTSIQIAKKVNWNLKSYPILTWKWRVTKIPEGANEEARGKNDSAASLYVIFPRNRIPLLSWKYQPVNVIKYVWSSSLPKGKIVKKDKVKFGATIYEGRFLVLQSGKKHIQKWIIETRNVFLDYMHLFGEQPEYDPMLIGILTDSNDTKSSAITDYDDIVIKMINASLKKKKKPGR